jgi:hypothetical protein
MSSFGPVVCDGVGQKFSPSPKTDWKEVFMGLMVNTMVVAGEVSGVRGYGRRYEDWADN